jgi:hypothetical protein
MSFTVSRAVTPRLGHKRFPLHILLLRKLAKIPAHVFAMHRSKNFFRGD